MKIIRGRSPQKSIGLAKKKRRLVFLKKAGLVFVVFLIFLAGVIYVLRRPELNISEISVRGTTVLRPAEIENTARERLAESYFRLVPKTSSFFYPHDVLFVDIASRFKRIETLSIERDGFNVLVITLSERPEHYLWCGRELILGERSLEDECFFVDSGGYVFSSAPYYSGNLFLEFYGPLSSGPSQNPLGGAVLPEENFGRVLSFVSALPELSEELKPIKVLAKVDGDIEVYLKDGGRVMVSLKNDLLKDIDYLRLSLSTEPLKSKMDMARENLDYLDIRFGNKVFYKFK